MARGSVLLIEGVVMPVVALVLFAIFVPLPFGREVPPVLGFGWRSWEQRRRTGSTGFRAICGSAPRSADQCPQLAR
jgi:hypothetical protein